MNKKMGKEDCIYCNGEGCIRQPDGEGCVEWVGCICINDTKEDTFIADLLDNAGAIE